MRIVISSDPRLLHVLRGAVSVCAQGVGFGESDAENMARAIDEAAANVIRHTYRNRREGRLALEIRCHSDRMEFFLEDTGPKVSPETLRPRPLEEVRPGGLGMHFIRSLMDEGDYDPDFAEGNRLRLVKYLPRKVISRDESSSQERG